MIRENGGITYGKERLCEIERTWLTENCNQMDSWIPYDWIAKADSGLRRDDIDFDMGFGVECIYFYELSL